MTTKLFLPGVSDAVDHRPVLYRDHDLGDVFVPEALTKLVSMAGRPAHHTLAHREVGVFVMVQKRPRWRCGERNHARVDQLERRGRGLPQSAEDLALTDGHSLECLDGFDIVETSITHNERVDEGAVIQDINCFGTASTPFTAVAVANASLTKLQANLSLGSNSANVTTNEFTASGLSRAAGSLSTYTAPASLGAVFSRIITKLMTASGSVTAYGAGLFDSTTVSGSHLYVEDNYASTAVMVSGDTLTSNITISN